MNRKYLVTISTSLSPSIGDCEGCISRDHGIIKFVVFIIYVYNNFYLGKCMLARTQWQNSGHLREKPEKRFGLSNETWAYFLSLD